MSLAREKKVFLQWSEEGYDSMKVHPKY
uniref:Uncharacterized protein n=1 Tax=Anguilla anguilla TaxID=7936 RepID=A0A0E9XNF4_ANGAN